MTHTGCNKVTLSTDVSVNVTIALLLSNTCLVITSVGKIMSAPALANIDAQIMLGISQITLTADCETVIGVSLNDEMISKITPV